MKVKKILETRLDILDIKNMYCSDYNEMILKILKDKYLLKCFKSIYVLDILRIIRKSALQCKSKVLDGSTYIDLTFEVLGIIYENGDIIHNCKIIQINNNGIMHAKSEYASLYIKNILEVHVFKENDEIPVLVKMSRYNIYDNEISVSSIPLVPILKKSTIFQISDIDVNQNQIMELFDFKELEQLENDIEIMSKSHKSVFNFFKELLYPFKKISITPGKKNKISLDNMQLLQQLDMIYMPNSYLIDDSYLVLNNSDKNKIMSMYDDTSILNINKQDLILHILNNYYRNLTHFIEFLKIYDTAEKIKNKSQFWSLYKTFKK